VTLSARGQVLAFSPKDSILAIGQQDSRILLWSTEFRHTVMTIRTHTGGVLGLQFSPDCLTLASSGNDGQVEVMRAQP
jgi:WD40 repeat protein